MLKDIRIHFVGGRIRTLPGQPEADARRFVRGWEGIRRDGQIFHTINADDGCVLYNAANVLEIEVVPSQTTSAPAAEGR